MIGIEIRQRGYYMKLKGIRISLTALTAIIMLGIGIRVQAKEGIIKTGIYAGDIDLSGMTGEQAKETISSYVSGLEDEQITLVAANNNEVAVTAGELGIAWANSELVQEALEIGSKGNVIERYKILKDLEYENKVYPVLLSFDIESINSILSGQCSVYDQKAVNYTLQKTNGEFRIIEGQTGFTLDVEKSIDVVNNYMVNEWNHGSAVIELVVTIEEPKGNAEELSQVRDMLGECTTSYSTSNSNRSGNVANGCTLIDGITLYPGEEFSTYDAVAPFTPSNGYYMAGSYLNGKVVDSLGGGICQVSTTLYNAVLMAELEITERHNHSMTVSYVDRSKDAAIAESSGKDFRFINNTDYPIYIEGYVQNKHITFKIYGKEYRPSNRKVAYVSEILETTNPEVDIIYADGGQPIGYIATESAHIGYKARLWKVVTEDGVEVSRTQVNSSSYKMVPRSATVGVSTADPNAYNEIMAAIGTNSIDHVKNVIAILIPQQQAAEGQPPEEQPPAEEQPAE